MNDWEDLPRSTRVVCWVITIFTVWTSICFDIALLEMT
jgi:hypothetical protein